MKADEKQKKRQRTVQSEDIPSDWGNRQKQNFDFVEMKSFLKTEF